ncbi:quinol oxidase polypeptide II [Brevibacillus borstelensis AK1]|uniref:Quinol oxidase subunit 2 n=2 Tax=Brevibacillus borstelensis TaxID=45462 RepID=M8E1U0_9BACL|nr:cytochrome aa3 quinol oxidase subunit II [Brevibacillus borstelensis]EMT53236.1 quinol oxidase polypeptide II [Brevibacillus borstelensis AK1]
MNKLGTIVSFSVANEEGVEEMNRAKTFRQMGFWLMAIIASVLLSGCGSDYVVLNPKGPVAETQYNLIMISVILCAIIIIPVLALTAFIVYRYRDTKDNKAPYKPDWAHSTTLEVIWWGIPVIIIAILGYFTVRDTYALKESPNQAVKPMTIQVTSLNWKWMFTYPEQNIATVNYLEIPAGVPVQFQLSADGPMNSFWVPELGGQIYAMSGMATELYLQADKPGEFYGRGANFTGEGFAHMEFKVEAKPQEEFDKWVQQVKNTTPVMTKEDYEELRKPGLTDKKTYSAFPEGLFEEIVMKHSHGHDMDYVMKKTMPATGQESGNKTDEASSTETHHHNH